MALDVNDPNGSFDFGLLWDGDDISGVKSRETEEIMFLMT